MFDFLRHWFQGNTAAPSDTTSRTPAEGVSQPSPTAPGTGIHYDPLLPQRLLDDHRRIESLFADMVAAAHVRDVVRLRQALDGFTTALRGHLLTENVRFYVYLQHTLGSDPENTALVHGFRREMQQIGRVLGDFLQRHGERETWDEAGWSRLSRELAELAPVLTKRIETEETILYPLYLPPQA
jgi:predicted membrane chloride channel (bestrophin family)